MSWTDAIGKKKEPPRKQRAKKVDASTVAPSAKNPAYVSAAFEKEIGAIRTAPEGTRNDTLNRSAFALGQFVGAGALDEGTVERALREAAEDAGLGDVEIRKTIASGLEDGMKDPREIPAPRAREVNEDGEVVDAPPDDDDGYEPTDPYAPPTSGRASTEAPPKTDAGKTALEPPTATDPLRGLKHLGLVAVVGRDAILTFATMAVVYLWQDIAVAGTIVLIAGPPAEGKTTLLFLILAARMNTGEAVTLLGRHIEPAPTGQWLVIIEGEHSDASTARKLVKSLRLLGLDDSGLDRCIVVARKAVKLHSPEWLDVQKLVAAGLVSDIAVDTVARVAPADANDEREQVGIYDEIARTIELAPDDSPKPTAWLAAHTRKNGTSGGLEDVSGSAQRTGQADSVLLIKGEKIGGRTMSTTITFAKLREDPDQYPMPVTFSIDATGIRTTDAAVAGAADDRPLEERVIDSLQAGPKTRNGLMQALKRSWHDIDEAIACLFEAKAIRTGSIRVRGRDFKTYELREGGTWKSKSTPDSTPDEG